MNTHIETNRALWDELVGVHVRAPNSYDIESFRGGRDTLKPIELEEVGDVEGKRLLHLQCHFGMDTISWVRRGASAVGADFSPEAIALARQLSAETGVGAEFVCSDIYELPQNLEGEFDIVFASYGVLCWLPDLDAWAKLINHYLAPGGFFYIVDPHPVGGMFSRDDELVASESYFNAGPIEDTRDGTYADQSAALQNKTSYQWQHPLSEIINALTANGLRIEFLHEFPFSVFRWLPSMEKSGDGWYRIPGRDDVPFLFSLKAAKSHGSVERR
jgi:SAM-dependent methyltransferase